MTLREAFIEQIIRDTGVLQEDAIYHVPSRAFYEDRIAACREAIAAIDNQQEAAMGGQHETFLHRRM